MEKSHEVHACEHIPKNGVAVIYDHELLDRKCGSWKLHVQREATEEDLETNHYLDCEGDIMWSLYVEITHCPYCGKPLEKFENERVDDMGRFVLVDFTGWRSKHL